MKKFALSVIAFVCLTSSGKSNMVVRRDVHRHVSRHAAAAPLLGRNLLRRNCVTGAGAVTQSYFYSKSFGSCATGKCGK